MGDDAGSHIHGGEMTAQTTPTLSEPGGGFRGLLEKWGLPAPLLLGYVGLLLFMIGDGVESGFIAPFMADHGAGDDIRASYVITVYGVAVMLASWLSGALSELWGPRRVMMLGFAIWIVFEVLFLADVVTGGYYTLMNVFSGILGICCSMFTYMLLDCINP